MAADDIEAAAMAMMRAGRNAAMVQLRNWEVPVVAYRNMMEGPNPWHGSATSSFQAEQFTTGWDGTKVILAFTSDWSVIEGTGLSDDYVTG